MIKLRLYECALIIMKSNYKKVRMNHSEEVRIWQGDIPGILKITL